MNSHLFGASDPKAAEARKELQDTFRAKHANVLQDDE